MGLDRVSTICLFLAVAIWTLGALWDFRNRNTAQIGHKKAHLPPPLPTLEDSATYAEALRAAGWKEESPGVWIHHDPHRDPGAPFDG